MAARCVDDKAVYFAEQLHKSMKGLGTDDKLLTRIIVSRCEVGLSRLCLLDSFSHGKIDMEDIKEAFLRLYKKPLSAWIKVQLATTYITDLCITISPCTG